MQPATWHYFQNTLLCMKCCFTLILQVILWFFDCQRTVKILFSAEVANIVYDLGWIMQVVKQPLLNWDATLSDALSLFGDELSTCNLEFEWLTHGFGPGVVSLVVTKLKDLLEEHNLQITVSKNTKNKHQELSESISPLVLKIGIFGTSSYWCFRWGNPK